MRPLARFASSLGVLLSAAALAACGDTPVTTERPAPPRRPNAAAAADGGNADATPEASGLRLELQDNDFTESDRTRDPFRSFAEQFRPQPANVALPQIESRLSQFALDELRLVAVITATDRPYAMVIPPTGRGTIIRPGDYVGRPETVGGGETATRVPWRVSRIVGSRITRDRNNDLAEVPGQVLFEREDRSNPNGLGRSERALTLNPAAAQAMEEANAAAGGAPGTPGSLPGTPGTPPGTPGGAPLAGSPFLPALPGMGAPPAGGAPNAAGARPGAPGSQAPTFVQQFTQVIPPQQQQAPVAPTVIIQNSQAPQQPQQPQQQPPTNQPPAVQIHDQVASPALPSSGLGSH